MSAGRRLVAWLRVAAWWLVAWRVRAARETRQLARIRRTLATRRFQRRFAAARAGEPAPITSLDQTRAIMLRVLASMGVDTAGALLTFSWEPSTGKLGAYVRPLRVRPSLPLSPRLDHP